MCWFIFLNISWWLLNCFFIIFCLICRLFSFWIVVFLLEEIFGLFFMSCIGGRGGIFLGRWFFDFIFLFGKILVWLLFWLVLRKLVLLFFLYMEMGSFCLDFWFGNVLLLVKLLLVLKNEILFLFLYKGIGMLCCVI